MFKMWAPLANITSLSPESVLRKFCKKLCIENNKIIYFSEIAPTNLLYTGENLLNHLYFYSFLIS